MKIEELQTFKQSAENITCLTAYDASFSQLFDECGVDIILVGDSLGNVIQGGENTLGVTMEDMIYHTQSVARGIKDTLLIADMPYQSYDNANQTLANARRLIDAGAQMVKFEGGQEHKDSFKILQANNIPVCGHLGLQPQSVIEMGGYKVQGRSDKDAQNMIQSALDLEAVGADCILLECVPTNLAKQITNTVKIPVIGIGAGVDTDGQILVLYDLIGISTGKIPKFSKNYLATKGSIQGAVAEYITEVKNKIFPSEDHTFN